MSYQVGDRVVYEIRASNDPGWGAGGSMSASARVPGQVSDVFGANRNSVRVRLEFPPPIGPMSVVFKASDPALSRVRA